MDVDSEKVGVPACAVSSGSVSVSLHPLVIMNISEHWTRVSAQEGKPMLGKQSCFVFNLHCSSLRLGATCLFPGHECLWLSLEVLLSWAHPTGTSYLSPLQTFSQYHLISSASSWKPHYLSVKTLARVGAHLIQVALYKCLIRIVWKTLSK